MGGNWRVIHTLRAEADNVAGLSESGGATYSPPSNVPPTIDYIRRSTFLQGPSRGAPDSENPATLGHGDGSLVGYIAECRHSRMWACSRPLVRGWLTAWFDPLAASGGCQSSVLCGAVTPTRLRFG